MADIRAHMATFPARLGILETALASIAPQCDRLDLVLNEFTEPPAFLAKFGNVNPIIPETDIKDVGKFLPRPRPDDAVFLVDDDILYGPDYTAHLLNEGTRIGLENHVIGLHALIYKRRIRSLRSRKMFYYSKRNRHSVVVDQLGTGTVLVLGRNLPEFDLMKDAQKFVDVRFAALCQSAGLSLVGVSRPAGMARTLGTNDGSIYQNFTRNSPQNVLAEVRAFAGRDPRLGKRV